MKCILRNCLALGKNALDEIKLGHDEYAAKGNGLAIRMENFDTYFGLKLSYLLFSVTEQLSINLQAKDITIQEAVSGAKLLVSHLKSLRTDAKYNAMKKSYVLVKVLHLSAKENSLEGLMMEQTHMCILLLRTDFVTSILKLWT